MRSAALLIVLAFILGLWIGFNPAARARASAAVERADAAVTQFGERVQAGIRGLFSKVSEESPPPANPPVEPRPSNFLGQVQEAIRQLWNGLVKLWNDLVNGRPAPATQNNR